MASDTMEAESVVHQKIRDLVLQVYRDHHIRIDSASIEWTSVSDAFSEGFVIKSITASTTTVEPRPGMKWE